MSKLEVFEFMLSLCLKNKTATVGFEREEFPWAMRKIYLKLVQTQNYDLVKNKNLTTRLLVNLSTCQLKKQYNFVTFFIIL